MTKSQRRLLQKFYELAFSLGYHCCEKMDTMPFRMYERDFAEKELRKVTAKLENLLDNGFFRGIVE